MKEDLRQRAITGVVLAGTFLLIVALAILYPSYLWILLVLLVVAILLGSQEALNFLPSGRSSTITLYSLSLTAVPSLLVIAGASLSFAAPGGAGIFSSVILYTVLMLLLAPFCFRNIPTNEISLYFQPLMAMALLLGLGGAALLSISLLPSGPSMLLWLVFVVSFADMGAYIGGRVFGGPKFSPTISPGKTISGAIAGLASAILIGVCSSILLPRFSPTLFAFVCSLLVALFSQAGDLTKSYIKRLRGVKDSGSILPGHGGVIDRIDGLLAGGVAFLATLEVFMRF